MEQQATEADFERLSWHDDTIYGLRFDVGDPERNEWHSNLVVDIDHIVEWLCDETGGARLRVALTWPQEGETAFGAGGFTLCLRAKPLLRDQQKLSPTERS